MKFILIGAAGYIAPKHMGAIRDVGGDLIACLDPHDSVGILDSYFPRCRYFSEFERFDRYCSQVDVDYCVVCSPNYLHDAHCRFGLRIGADVICEKPLVLNSHNLVGLRSMEKESGHRIWNILQLRLGDACRQIRCANLDGHLSLQYSVSRGLWYDYSWKANPEKSGGILFNIGIHLFDLLIHLFGPVTKINKWIGAERMHAGAITFGAHTVYIRLDISYGDYPCRVFATDDQEFDLSQNFTNLHVESYHQIINRNGFGIDDVEPAIKLCEQLRGMV